MAEVRMIDINFETSAPEVQRQIEDLTKELNEVADAQKKSAKEQDKLNKEIKEYDKALESTIGDTKIFGTSLNDVKDAADKALKSIRGMIRSLGALRSAILLVGLGAFGIALAGVVSIIRDTEAGANKFNRALNNSKLTLRSLSKAARDFATDLRNIGKEEDKNAKQRELTDGQIEKEVRRLQTLIDTRREELADRDNANRAAINDLEKRRAVQKSIAEDTDADEQDRIRAAEKFADQSLQIQRLRKASINDLVAINNLQLKQADLLGENNQEFENQAQDLDDQLAAIERTTEEQVLTNRNLLNTIIDQLEAQKLITREKAEQLRLTIAAQNAQRVTGEQDDPVERVETEKTVQGGITKATRQGVLDRVALFTGLATINDGIAQKRLDDAKIISKTDQELADERIDNAIIVGNTLTSISNSLLGQSKAAALFEATINTAVGITGAFRDVTVPLAARFAAAVAIAASGVAQIAAIESAPEPNNREPFASGGFINGRSHRAGGVPIEAEGGEFIINKASMSIPGVAEAAMSLNNMARPKFQFGGLVPNESVQTTQLENILRSIDNQQVVLVTEDLNAVENRVTVTEQRASL